MPVFADVIPEPYFDVYSPTSTYIPGIIHSIFRTGGILLVIILVALFIFWIICLRKIFKKAGLPGRGSLIPVYRECLRFRMVGRNEWWTASLLCPAMFIFIIIFSYFKIAEKFGKDKEQFGMGLWFLHPVFLGILAFDKSKYK